VLPIGGLVVIVVALAAGVVMSARAIGGESVAVVAALMVVAVGAWFARLPVSDEYVREIREQLERHRGVYVPDELLSNQTRRDRRVLGAAAMLGGGVWLTFALAAL